MTEPTKTNADIQADYQAFQAAYERARQQLGKLPGVGSVAFGQKKVGNAYTDTIAIIVYVREKKADEALAPEERIPKSFEGYPTDVRVVPTVRPQACSPKTAKFDNIQGGIQVAPKANGGHFETGTLACIVRKRGDIGRENVYLLTNMHVLFTSWAGANDYAFHPFPPLGSEFESPGPSHDLGPVQSPAFYGDEAFVLPDPANPGGTRTVNFFIDCAIARINIDSKCCGSTCTKDTTHTAETIDGLGLATGNVITDVRNVFTTPFTVNEKVFKVGITTGRTTGLLRAVGAGVNIPADFNNPTGPTKHVSNTLEIEFDPASDPTHKNCAGHAYFTEKGDSGALIVDEQGRAIGLHSVGPVPGDPDGSTSNACNIVAVLDKLGICIPTSTGHSHGSTKATDGSGLTAAPPPPGEIGDFPEPDGQIGFALEESPSAPWPEPAPVTDDEEQHMRAMLAELRSTRMGRELHELFGRYRREIGYLVRNHRLVKAAWHRNKGPAFLAHVLNHLKGHADGVPREVDGVSAVALLTRMSELLRKYGSNPLREAIEELEVHRDEALSLLANCHSAGDCIAYLKAREAS